MNTDRILPVNKEHLLLMQVLCWLGPGMRNFWSVKDPLTDEVVGLGSKEIYYLFANYVRHVLSQDG